MSATIAFEQHRTPAITEPSKLGTAAFAAVVGKRLAALRNDPPIFSDQLATQALVDSVWRRALDSAGSAVIDLSREMETR